MQSNYNYNKMTFGIKMKLILIKQIYLLILINFMIIMINMINLITI